MIEIKKSNNADTRTADKNASLEDFKKANYSHINDVSRIMEMLGNILIECGKMHDYTKKEHELEEYNAFKEALDNNKDFSKSSWYLMHVTTKRHHLFKHVPEDVNLIDVLEMTSDIIAAALARSNERITELNLDNELLKKALKNTIELINNNVKLID